MASYHVSHESNQPQAASPLYSPIMEAPPPPYPPTSTRRFQDYYSGYGQPHPPPLRPYRDEYYGEGEYGGCFPFLRTCLTTLCCCWFVERCCLPSRY
ncbi:hypothetical protein N665_2033s0005 [Sinapis alba]|nr:hypothetical protein N665_2033s0005 [Sinapis alba]